MKKVITEHELATRSASLREMMAQLERKRTNEELAGPTDTFIKDQNGEWIENPAKAQTPAGWTPTPDQAKWLGSANQQDPYILRRMPGIKPPISHFKDPQDQVLAKRLGFPEAPTSAPDRSITPAPEVVSSTPVTPQSSISSNSLPPLNESVSYSNEETLVRIVENLNEYIMLSEGTAAGIVPDGSILKANQLVWSPDSDNGKRFGGKDLEKLGDGRWCADGYCIFHKDYRAILDKIWFDKNSSPTTPAKAKTSAFEPGIDAKNTGSWDSKQIDYKGTVQAQAIQHANNIANVNSIVVGKTLDIPGVGTYKIAPGDTLDAIAAGRYKKPDNLQKSDSGIWNKGPNESDAEKQRNIRKNFNARDQSTRDQEERIKQVARDDTWQNGPNQHEPENQRLGMNEAVGFQADEVTRIVSLIHYK
jgi:LysM domain